MRRVHSENSGPPNPRSQLLLSGSKPSEDRHRDQMAHWATWETRSAGRGGSRPQTGGPGAPGAPWPEGIHVSDTSVWKGPPPDSHLRQKGPNRRPCRGEAFPPVKCKHVWRNCLQGHERQRGLVEEVASSASGVVSYCASWNPGDPELHDMFWVLQMF